MHTSTKALVLSVIVVLGLGMTMPRDGTFGTFLERYFLVAPFDACQHTTVTIPAQPVSLNIATAAVGSTVMTLAINCTLAVTANLSVPTTLTLDIPRRGMLDVQTGVTLTLPCDNILAQDYQIFTGSGTVVCSDAPPALRIAWFSNSTDDSVQMQTAINALVNGGMLLAARKTYSLVEKTSGTDKFAVKINKSNITLDCQGATLQRSVASAYALFFLGEPDSDSNQVSYITLTRCLFHGSDIRHALSGGAPKDYRTILQLRNTRHVTIKQSRFDNVDSSILYADSPLANTITYNANLDFVHNKVFCNAHAVAQRALIHALYLGGVDNVTVSNNYVLWCDDFVASDGTFNLLNDPDGSTYTHATLGAVPRSGRVMVIANNEIYNSSEHAIYANSMDVTVTGNTITTVTPSICLSNIKFAARGLSISGNILKGRNGVVTLQNVAQNVAIVGNSITGLFSLDGGAVALEMVDASAYIANRPYLSGFLPAVNVKIANNSFSYEGTAPSSIDNVNTSRAVRVRTSVPGGDPNFDVAGNQYQIIGLSVTENDMSNFTHAITFIGGGYMQHITVTNNSFFGWPLSVLEVNHTDGMLPMVSQYVISVDNAFALQNKMIFSNNSIYGYQAVFGKLPDTGALSFVYPPMMFNGNKLNHVNAFDNGTYRLYGSIAELVASSNAYFYYYGPYLEQNAVLRSSHGGTYTERCQEETLSIGSGVTTKATTILLLGNQSTLAVPVRVVTQPGGTVTMTVKATTTGNFFQNGASVSTVAGTRDTGMKGVPYNYAGVADQTVTLTFDVPTTDALGVVRVGICGVESRAAGD